MTDDGQTTWEIWLKPAKQVGSVKEALFLKSDNMFGVVEHFVQLLRQADVGDMIMLGVHDTAEYTQ